MPEKSLRSLLIKNRVKWKDEEKELVLLQQRKERSFGTSERERKQLATLDNGMQWNGN